MNGSDDYAVRKVDPNSCNYRQLGSIHLHVDGGPQIEPVRRIISAYGGKLQQVLHAVAGPQRQDLTEVYQSHTPGDIERESFEFFSTLLLASRDDTITTVRKILPTLISYPGVIIELERIVAVGNSVRSTTQWQETDASAINPLSAQEVNSQQAYTLPIEIHHGINISKESTFYPIPLSQLLSISSKLGMHVGGWFLFEKDDSWAYRSNEFTTLDRFQQEMREQHLKLHDYLSKVGIQSQLWTIAERVMGIWRT